MDVGRLLPVSVKTRVLRTRHLRGEPGNAPTKGAVRAPSAEVGAGPTVRPALPSSAQRYQREHK